MSRLHVDLDVDGSPPSSHQPDDSTRRQSDAVVRQEVDDLDLALAGPKDGAQDVGLRLVGLLAGAGLAGGTDAHGAALRVEQPEQAGGLVEATGAVPVDGAVGTYEGGGGGVTDEAAL